MNMFMWSQYKNCSFICELVAETCANIEAHVFLFLWNRMLYAISVNSVILQCTLSLVQSPFEEAMIADIQEYSTETAVQNRVKVVKIGNMWFEAITLGAVVWNA